MKPIFFITILALVLIGHSIPDSGCNESLEELVEFIPSEPEKELEPLEELLRDLSTKGEKAGPGLEALYRLCTETSDSPVPVIIASEEEFWLYIARSRSRNLGDAERLNAFYVSNNYAQPGYPREFFLIKEHSNPDALVSRYHHELGHYNCRKNGCYCVADEVSGEIHAYSHELRACLERGLDQSLEISVRNIAGLFLDSSLGEPRGQALDVYGFAAFVVIDTTLWNQCLDYLKALGK
jgi:hypothetical protein